MKHNRWFLLTAVSALLTGVATGETVVVTAEGISKPVAVRFGWQQLAEPNLANGAGLPASPFRTDTWTDPENVKLQSMTGNCVICAEVDSPPHLF